MLRIHVLCCVRCICVCVPWRVLTQSCVCVVAHPWCDMLLMCVTLFVHVWCFVRNPVPAAATKKSVITSHDVLYPVEADVGSVSPMSDDGGGGALLQQEKVTQGRTEWMEQTEMCALPHRCYTMAVEHVSIAECLVTLFLFVLFLLLFASCLLLWYVRRILLIFVLRS